MNRLQNIRTFGQQIWLDNLSAGLIASGELAQLIAEDGIAGVTSNPAIFYNAINSDSRYLARLKVLPEHGLSAEQRYEAIVIPDVQDACDLLSTCYQSTQGAGGYVSLEVSPHLAHDLSGTLTNARRLWQLVSRKNLMIKIPATQAGISALKILTKEGINVNVTLLFSLKQVNAVWNAYIGGLLERKSAGETTFGIKAVASFFLSRIDSLLDNQLPENLRGKSAIALARVAYSNYQKLFHGEQFAALRQSGAYPQYLLWASTGTKNPDYSDVLYVENLIGPESINTIPDATLALFRQHGVAAQTLSKNQEEAHEILLQVQQLGIDLDAVGEQLQQNGLQLFINAFDKLLEISA